MNVASTLRKLSNIAKLTAPLIEGAFLRREGLMVDVRAVTIGSKPAFEIVSSEGKFLLLERPVSYHNKRSGRATGFQLNLLEYAIPLPLHMGYGDALKGFYDAKRSQQSNAVDKWFYEHFEIRLATAYFSQYFCHSEALKDYRLIIFEAIEAFYMGLDNIAIMSLFPVFEGGLRNLQEKMIGVDKGNVSSKIFSKGLKKILTDWGRRSVAEYDWHPGMYGYEAVEFDFYTHICPQSDVINSFRLFFEQVLYKSTPQAGEGFNRHLVVHLLKNDFNISTNFMRIFLVLTHITFIESLTNKSIPFFWPGYSQESNRLGDYIEIIGGRMDGRRSLLREFGLPDYPKVGFDLGDVGD
ncbi:hypothetical protein HX798_20535 [Pseudomonas putida]|uniref:Uncharacterized protein n=1 Tax=Pseudomonas putida TaxID=303 RepID=A0A7Y8D3Q4_PSEPU|nr:hypothetical protein [Pseudomonas putida]NWC82656.1 hypothetical protein [Pseudomonas putida]